MYTVHSRLTQDMLKYKLWIGTVCALQPGAGYMFYVYMFCLKMHQSQWFVSDSLCPAGPCGVVV